LDTILVDPSDSIFKLVKKEVNRLYRHINATFDIFLIGKGLKGIIIEITSGNDFLKPDELESLLKKILTTQYKNVTIQASCGFRGK
jgi:hypothetical protein